MKIKFIYGVCLVASVLFFLNISPVYAHGIGERYDLPLPLWMYLAGAAATVGMSFIVIGKSIDKALNSNNYPKVLIQRTSFPGNFLMNPWLLNFIRLCSIFIFALVIGAGFFGNQDQLRNFSPVFIWIIWSVGLAFFVPLIGNIWQLINPWKIIFTWVEKIYKTLTGGKLLSLNLDYPTNIGLWPSIILLLLFAWIENVYTRSAVPRDLALMTTIYTAITLTGMFIFGRDKWLSNGEAFAVLYKFLGKFSPIEIRTHNKDQCSNCPSDCEIYEGHCYDCDSCISSAPTNEIELILRPHAIGLARPFVSTFSEMTFIILMLSIVAFDGLKATPLWFEITNIAYGYLPFLGTRAVQFVNTVGLITLPIIFFLTYAIFSRLTAIASSSNRKSLRTLDVCKSFMPALIPIAIAYNIAHYVILIVISGQLFIPIISDPFGAGWNIFSTSSYEPKFDILNAKFIWFTSVGAIVAGHILALYLSHVIALKRFIQNASVLKSQSPMVILMIFYTISSLWILAQPIVETR